VAERHFRAALERKPSAPAYAGLGLALYQQGEVDEAIASLRAGIAADPKHPVSYDQLGVILTEQGKLEEAAANYRMLVDAQPSASAHQKLAQVLMQLGRSDEAERALRAK
jgi:tetratricopeptide (TPR) repeat protein